MNVDASLRVGESILPPSNEVKSLGCWFDTQLKMDCHINKVCKAAFFHLFNIRRIRKCLSSELRKHRLMLLSQVALTFVIAYSRAFRHVNYKSYNVYKMRQLDSFVMLAASITSHQPLMIYTGFLLNTKLILKSYLLLSKHLTVSHLHIYANYYLLNLSRNTI